MSTFMTLTAMVVTIGSTDYSADINKAEVTADIDEQDITTYGSAGWKEVQGGLKSAQLNLSIKSEQASGSINDMLWSNFGSNLAFTVKNSSATTSATNPKFSGTVLIKPGKLLGGTVGEVDSQDLTLTISGAVSRTTS